MRRALAFLTPLGGAAVPDRGTVAWFPVAGAAIGTAVGTLWWGAYRLWPPGVAAAIAVTADLALTGLLHADGLIDSADGLLPQVPRDRRLEIMAEPAVGAYGVLAAIAVFLLRYDALTALQPDFVLLSGIWCGSRTVMAVTVRALPYARETGLATAMRGGDWRPVALYGFAAAVLLGAVAAGAAAVVAVVTGMAAGFALVAAARRRLGGYTGDVLGAAGVIAETVALIAVAAW